MGYEVETVKIKTVPCEGNPDGIVVINKSDFVEGEHELATEEGNPRSVKEQEEKRDPAPKVEQAKATTPVQPWVKQA